MKKILSVIMACVLLLCTCACSSAPTLVTDDPSINIPSPTTKQDSVFGVGDSAELDGVIVTFVGITESKGSKYNKPDSGNVYVLCEFEITNNSNEELNVSSLMSFEAYCDDYSCEYSLNALIEKDNKDQLDGTVAVGKKMKGVIGYEVSAEWSELEIRYVTDLFSNSQFIFVATNE